MYTVHATNKLLSLLILSLSSNYQVSCDQTNSAQIFVLSNIKNREPLPKSDVFFFIIIYGDYYMYIYLLRAEFG